MFEMKYNSKIYFDNKSLVRKRCEVMTLGLVMCGMAQWYYQQYR